MFQVNLRIWNRVAATGKLRSAWGKTLLAETDQETVDLAWEEWDRTNAKEDPRVLLSYQLVLPLLVEREAIDALVEEADDPGLRGALPEVLNRSEAVSLATREYRLTESQQKRLMHLLPETLGDLTQAWEPILEMVMAGR